MSQARFDLGRLKLGGSAAVLLGGVWFFNGQLDPQLERIRSERKIERFSFDFDEHVEPSKGWFGINEGTGEPVEVKFTDPVTDEVVETVEIPSSSEWSRSLIGWKPATIYGVQRLYIARGDDLPVGMARRWGNTECLGASMPFEIEAVKFQDDFVYYHLKRCDAAEGADPDHTSALQSRQGELVELEIKGSPRRFLVAVLATDHRPRPELNGPPWSTFLVIEIEASR